MLELLERDPLAQQYIHEVHVELRNQKLARVQLQVCLAVVVPLLMGAITTHRMPVDCQRSIGGSINSLQRS